LLILKAGNEVTGVAINDPAAIPPRDQCVLLAMLDAQAQCYGEKPLIVFEQDEQWTYGQAARIARETAGALQRIGIQRGESVLVWLSSTSDIVRIHFGLCYQGGIFVPINLALKRSVLEHIIVNSAATTIICHADLVPRLKSVALGGLERRVVIGGGATGPLNFEYLDAGVLQGKAEDFVEPEPPMQPWELHGIFYTSGTTGPFQGCYRTASAHGDA
jgi:crotonobetaine/carnitine-CoA ligase